MSALQAQHGEAIRLVVGCPVYERGWVLSHWFDALAGWEPYLDIEYVFIYTPSNDNTLDLIIDHEVIEYPQGTHGTKRDWGNKDRLTTLADMRNLLLGEVRKRQPDFYLSLDSDILVPPWHQAKDLFEGFEHYDAIAPLVYLGLGSITNAFYQDRHRRTRAKVYDALAPVNIICAAKLMSPNVFMDPRVEYGHHTAGEDLYWSNMATTYGYRLGFHSGVKCKHIMKQDQLDRVDNRVGF